MQQLVTIRGAYVKWRSSSRNRVFDIPQSVANVGKCEKSCPFSDAQECVYNIYNVNVLYNVLKGVGMFHQCN